MYLSTEDALVLIISGVLSLWLTIWAIATLRRIRIATEESAQTSVATLHAVRELLAAGREGRGPATAAAELVAETPKPRGSCGNCGGLGTVGEYCSAKECRRGGFEYTPDKRPA